VGRDSANVLFFGRDTVFLWAGSYAQQGPTAFVDTDGGFHTYEIRVLHRSAITVFQDGLQILAGSIMVHPNFSDAPFLYWGDGTDAAFGVSEWEFFLHNANTMVCGAAPLPVVPNPGVHGPRISLISYPNPARGPVTFALRASGAQRGPARVRVYDVAGRLVRSMELGPVREGLTTLRWDGTDDRGRGVSSGAYVLRLDVAGKQQGFIKATVLR
jgi:hypothetical protein